MSRTGPLSRICSLWGPMVVILIISCSQAKGADFYHDRWALLVGVEQFENAAIPPLQFCGDDVEALKRLLIDRFGFAADHIVALTDSNATKGAIVRELSRLSDRRLVSVEDAVLVYFTGHGQTVPLPRGGEMGFLVPYDGAVDLNDLTNPAPYYETCVGMDELRRLSVLIPAKHVLFLVDACYSGLAVEAARGIKAKSTLETVATRPVRQIIVAGLKDEQALEIPEKKHGAFTYALLEGLETGAADFNQDSVITGMELATYLRDAVPRLAPHTPHYASFDGDGEFLFTLSRPQTEVGSSGPRIEFTGPAELAAGGGVARVEPVGGSVVVEGLVFDSHAIAGLTIDDRPVTLVTAEIRELECAKRPTEQEVMRFRTQVKIEQGETRTVVFRADNTLGQEVFSRVVLRAVASDTQAPQIRITEVRAYDADGSEVHWSGVTQAARGSTRALKRVAIAPEGGEYFSVAGFARDDRSVVSVVVSGEAAETRPANQHELAGLGWDAGVAFEGTVTMPQVEARVVEVTASDAAGNEARETVSLHRAVERGPEVLILDPPQTRDIRGTGLLVPKNMTALRIAGLARSDCGILKVTVGGQPAETHAATAEELKGTDWRTPVTFFSAGVPVPATGVTTGLVVEVVDQEGRSATKTVLAQRPGPPVRLSLSSDKDVYRVGDWVHFSLSTERDAYVYVFHREPDGSLSLFLPNPVEPDCLLPAGASRTFPNSEDEKRWRGQYGLVAQEPTGTDTVYSLALPDPLPASLLGSLGSLENVGDALVTTGRLRGTKLIVPAMVSEGDIARLAEQLNGTWAAIQYEVRK